MQWLDGSTVYIYGGLQNEEMANHEKREQEAAYPIPIYLSPMHCPVTVGMGYADSFVSLFFMICHLCIPLEMIFLHLFHLYLWLQSQGASPQKSSARYRFKKRAIPCARRSCGQSGRGRIENGIVHCYVVQSGERDMRE